MTCVHATPVNSLEGWTGKVIIDREQFNITREVFSDGTVLAIYSEKLHEPVDGLEVFRTCRQIGFSRRAEKPIIRIVLRLATQHERILQVDPLAVDLNSSAR